MKVNRYPETKNKTLQAWNAADEYLIQHISENNIDRTTLAIFHDRFGYLSCHLSDDQPDIIVYLFSQQKSILNNYDNNRLKPPQSFIDPLTTAVEKKWQNVIIHLPKSLDLFELYLQMIYRFSNDEVKVYCGFMTRHYTQKIQEIASRYFMEIVQSRAFKKSRIITFTQKRKSIEIKPLIRSIFYGKIFCQHYGVFSSGKVDKATRFLLENLELMPHENKILDWGCGNGIIGISLTENTGKEVTFMDDNILAIHSVQLNTKAGHFIWNNDIRSQNTCTFDLIVTNPPFHFEHETDISISLSFFEETKYYLSAGARLVIVANKHLNYLTHLKKSFHHTNILRENQKFILYQCTDPIDQRTED